MRAIFLDCFSGISGNMLLGALLDAGVPKDYLEQELKKLSVSGYSLEVTKVKKQGISCFHVEVPFKKWFQPSRHLKDIKKIIEESGLSDLVQTKALAVFTRLAEAEAKVHGTSIEKIHFHEVGAVDAIVDIVGTIIGLEYLGIEHIAVSRLHVGSGFVKCAHGRMPVPAPATVELLAGIPFYSTEITGELVTPTGAAIVATLGQNYGSMPSNFHMRKVAYGAGTMDLEIANVLRMYIGELAEESDHESVKVVETNMDDLNPQIYGYVMEKLFSAGASDVYLSALLMKKGRPGTKLTVVVQEKYLKAIIDVIFAETSTIGLRIFDCECTHLERTISTVETEWGPVRVKTGKAGEAVMNVSPEYEDLKRIAQEYNLPLKVVYTTVLGRLAARTT